MRAGDSTGRQRWKPHERDRRADTELTAIRTFLDPGAGLPAALVLDGEAGIGKTTLWRAGVDAARSRGYPVLSATPTAAETSFSFAALTDLLEPVLDDALPALPEPQRYALEVALLRAEAKELPLNSRGVAAGVLSVLRWLAVRGPVVVAIDDAQWLDDPSAAALGFALRRLREDSVGLLLAQRRRAPSLRCRSGWSAGSIRSHALRSDRSA